jgi:hypothetical protein
MSEDDRRPAAKGAGKMTDPERVPSFFVVLIVVGLGTADKATSAESVTPNQAALGDGNGNGS